MRELYTPNSPPGSRGDSGQSSEESLRCKAGIYAAALLYKFSTIGFPGIRDKGCARKREKLVDTALTVVRMLVQNI